MGQNGTLGSKISTIALNFTYTYTIEGHNTVFAKYFNVSCFVVYFFLMMMMTPDVIENKMTALRRFGRQR